MQLNVRIEPVNHQSSSQTVSPSEPSSTEETRVSSTALPILETFQVDMVDIIIKLIPPKGRFALRFIKCLSTYDVHSGTAKDAMLYAAKIGSVKYAEWLFNKLLNRKLPWEFIQPAAEAGSLPLIQWAHNGHDPKIINYIWGNVARGGHIEILQWARANGYSWDKHMSYLIAQSGRLEVLKWAHANGCPLDVDICNIAAEGGHLEMLKWAHANSCHWDEWTSYVAARSGHLEVLQWAHANGCPVDERVCDEAAYWGNLHMLKWALENGCPWRETVCKLAARNGDLAMLKWARENGCPWNVETCCCAAFSGHLEVLQWARENGCPWNKEECLKEAKDHPSVRKWIGEQVISEKL